VRSGTAQDTDRLLRRLAAVIERVPGQGRGRNRGRRGRVIRRFWRLKFWYARLRRLALTKTTFIAVTGSCGKTLTTNLTGAIVATDGASYLGIDANHVTRSVRAVLSAGSSTKYVVQEVAANRLEIADHVRVLRPHIAIVTTIGSDHYRIFRSLEAAAKEKGKLVEKLPRRGTAILNADDPHVRAMAERTRAKALMFGCSPEADIRAVEVSSAWPDRLALTVVHGNDSVRVHTRLVGEHWTASVLAAIACGIACGIDLRICAEAVETVDPMFGRYSVHANPGGPVFVLDTLKAPLWTISSSLDFLARARAPRKTAVFGTLSDYPGDRSGKYRKVARLALEAADRVLFVGPPAGHVSRLRQADVRQRLFNFESSYQASAFLAEDTLPDELIYVKASATDHLERVMLSQLDQVVCWREQCGRKYGQCPSCDDYRKPHGPPFGLADTGAPVHVRALRR